ncbi:MAG: ABC transporter permease [Actinobacteria bacterium]|nr:ABC transporter permease [Actinomycetota bacterium]
MPSVPVLSRPILPAVRSLLVNLRDLWHARQLLRQLVQKELKVRYKHSALGFLWSLITPILMTVVFTAVFAIIIRIQVQDFAAFFIAGYLVWSFFQNAVQNSVQAITGNGALIRKVYFPREVLPLSNVVAQGVHFLLALLAISPYLVWTRGIGVVAHLPAVALGIVLIGVFASGLAMLFAAANVSFRDLQELVVVIFLVWFYLTPIIYPLQMVIDVAGDSAVGAVALQIVRANPLTWFVEVFRYPLYGIVRTTGENASSTLPVWPSGELILATTSVALVSFLAGYLVFHRNALTFAKEV